MVSRVPNSTQNINPSQLGTCESFVDKGDAKVMLSAIMSISIIRDDMIFGALAIGR